MNPSSLLSLFDSTTRLYELRFKNTIPDLGSGSLLVEAFAAVEALHAVGSRDLIVFSTNAHIALKTLLGQAATLEISLADGSRTSFSGLVNQAAQLGSEGGFARYRLRLVPWAWLLSQSATSRVWQNQSVLDIVDAVLACHAPHAAWTWSSEVGPFLQDARRRTYCNQYRETDLAFISRILAEEGLSWRIEEHADSPASHRMVLFADSTQLDAVPEDATSAVIAGIRYHDARNGEQQDSVCQVGVRHRFQPSLATVASYHSDAKQVVAAASPTHARYRGANAPILETYDCPPDGFASAEEASRTARLQMESFETRRETWQGIAAVRTLRPGTRFTLTQDPGQLPDSPDPVLAVTRVVSVGINNLPRPAQESLTELFGSLPELLQECLDDGQTPPSRHAATDSDTVARDWNKDSDVTFTVREAIALAQSFGYANRFDAIPADIPWRAATHDDDGIPLYPAPTALGSQTAIVVGPDGQSSPNGADEIYCDRQGRIRIRFHWQGHHGDGAATCWVRVAQRWAGGGFGSQFLPRIGQEVLVRFLDNDIDRPIVVGALYNGQGDGGVIPTPGGKHDRQANLTAFDPAHDHAVSAQNNLTGGHSPVWHGAAADDKGHRNGSAQWGIRSKEFGGQGYNQLVIDDTDSQGRIQLKSTQYASSLELGHLIHTADNYRGSLRGQGIELRTDAYGAIRAGQGLLLTTYGIEHNAQSRTPAGDNAAGMAHLKQATQLAASFSQAAQEHKTVTYASHAGSTKADTSTIDDQAAPLKALLKAASGMVDERSFDAALNDVANKRTQPGTGTLPHSTDPMISIAAKAGLGMAAGQNIQFAIGETATFMSGADTQCITGGALRMHAGQAIGMLAGAVAPGEGNTGLQLIAAKDPIDIQAQSGTVDIKAKDLIDIVSANSHIDWAAAKSISLSTAGGANITIEGGNITVQCPGKILIQAGKKSLVGPDSMNYGMPQMPSGAPVCIDCLLKALKSGSPVAAV